MNTITTGAAALLAVALLLTGCAPLSDTTPSPPPTAEVPVFETGQVVEQEAEVAEGQQVYPLLDGTHVVVTKTEPLPDAVQAELNAKAVAAMPVRDAPAMMDNGTMDAASAAVAATQADAIRATGKRVIFVVRYIGWPVDPGEGDWDKISFWNIMGGPNGSLILTHEEAAKRIDDFLAQADDPETYAVVWSE